MASSKIPDRYPRCHCCVTKHGVQTTIGIVAVDRKIAVHTATTIWSVTSHQDLAVRLDLNASRTVITSTNVSRHLPIVTEAGIQGSIGIVTRQRYVTFTSNDALVARRNNFAVLLLHSHIGYRLIGPKVGENLAAMVECGIQRSIQVVTCQCKITIASTRRHNLIVGLDRKRLYRICSPWTRTEFSCYPPIATKGRV